MTVTAEHIREKLTKDLEAVRVLSNVACLNAFQHLGMLLTQRQVFSQLLDRLRSWLTGRPVNNTNAFVIQDVEDTTNNRCTTSFKVLVVSPQFEGKPLLQRHRMVNTCLAEELKEIHAFEQKTLTPEQWDKQNAQ